MTAVVNYALGNIYSVLAATARCGEKVFLSHRRQLLEKADCIILPGVGAFSEGMRNLKRLGLDNFLREQICSGKPFLGICLGLQLLFEWSEEGNCPGLGILPGRVVRFRKDSLLVPHMGWNQVHWQSPGKKYLQMCGQDCYFYFAHSYYVIPRDRKVVAGVTHYGGKFVSAICWKNVTGVQFHPEKSGKSGLSFLSVFLKQKEQNKEQGE